MKLRSEYKYYNQKTYYDDTRREYALNNKREMERLCEDYVRQDYVRHVDEPGFDFDAWIENDILSTIPPCAIAPEFYAYAVCAQCHSIIRIDTDVLDALTYTMSPRTIFDSFCPVCEENSHYMCDGLSWLNITNIPDECVVELCKDAERLTRIDYVDLE